MPTLSGEQHPRAKLTADQVACIQGEYRPGHVTMCNLAREYRVSESTISRIINGKTWAVVSPSDTIN